MRSPARKLPFPLLAALALGAFGAALTHIFSGAQRFWTNLLLWFVFYATIGLGSLFIVALGHLVGPVWSVTVRRVAERVSSLILPAIPMGIAAICSAPLLYPWAKAEGLQSKIVAGKAAWLNMPFFSIRSVACLAAWYISCRILVGGSLKQDSDRDIEFSIKAKKFSALYMAIFAVTITLVAFDWISSLEPEWYSDMFGVYIFAGSFVAGLAATALGISYLKGLGRLEKVRPDHLYNLGALLFAFTVFWSYIAFAQYMLIWYGNMPEEVFWYKERLAGPWSAITLAIAVTHFLIPFFALVSRRAKSDIRYLARIATVVLLAHFLDLMWLILPVMGRHLLPGWPEASFALLFGSVAVAWLRRMMKVGEDMPIGDPRLEEGLNFHLK